MRVNPLDAETCVSCGNDDFDTLDLTPPDWDSAEAYEQLGLPEDKES